MDDIIGAANKWTIQEVVKACSISRPTVQKALTSGELQGVQSKNKKWYIDPETARTWERTKKKRQAWNARSAPVVVQADQTEVVDLLKAQVQQLQEQLAVKDQQLTTAQGTVEKQMVLLGHQQEQDTSRQDQLLVKDQQIATAQAALDKQMLLTEKQQEQSNKGLFRRVFGG